MTTDAHYPAALARAHAMRVFCSNLATFAIINIVLFLIDLVTGGGWWFYWVTICWGIGLLFHAWRVFRPGQGPGDRWERRTQEIYSPRTRNHRPATMYP